MEQYYICCRRNKKEPQQNIRGLFIGVLIIITIYCTANIAYIYALPINKMAASNFVASDAATATWGIIGGSVICFNGNAFNTWHNCGNIFCLAVLLLPCVQKVNYSAGQAKCNQIITHRNALILNAVWTIILIISGSFDMLTEHADFLLPGFWKQLRLALFLLCYKNEKCRTSIQSLGLPFCYLFLCFIYSFSLFLPYIKMFLTTQPENQH